MHAPPAVVAILILSALLPGGGWARSTGAPSAACTRIFPEGHGGASQDLASSPYNLNISALGDGYLPGETYVLTLSGTTSFRGLLVQARSMADDTPVGSFVAEAGITRLSSCARADSAITHISRIVKTSVQLNFTAPAAGTGPLRFLYAVVQSFNVYYATSESAAVEEQSAVPETVEVSFIEDTPMVTGNDVMVRLAVSPPGVPLLCQLITHSSQPQSPVIVSEVNCSSGEVTFTNVAGAKYRLRVIAGDNHAVIRTRVLLMPDTPNFCSLNAINDGVTEVLDSNGEISSYILEFRPIGRDVGFVCIIDRSEEVFPCVSPFEVTARDGLERVKVIPNPTMCAGSDRRPLVFRLQ